MKLKLGMTVYRSEVGHRGFFYPVKDEPLTLSSTTTVDDLQWVGGGSELKPLYADGSISAFDSDGHYHHFGGVFWVSKECSNKMNREKREDACK